jgi:hypothetical protein
MIKPVYDLIERQHENNVKIMVLLILEKFSNIKMIIFHKEIIPNRMNK